MAMMASGASDPFHNGFDDDDNDLLETDPLDGGKTASGLQLKSISNLSTEVEPDVPTTYSTSDRTPLTGNIQSSSSQNPVSQNRGYLTSAIAGEDRRAPQNTIDESVWETV